MQEEAVAYFIYVTKVGKSRAASMIIMVVSSSSSSSSSYSYILF